MYMNQKVIQVTNFLHCLAWNGLMLFVGRIFWSYSILS